MFNLINAIQVWFVVNMDIEKIFVCGNRIICQANATW